MAAHRRLVLTTAVHASTFGHDLGTVFDGSGMLARLLAVGIIRPRPPASPAGSLTKASCPVSSGSRTGVASPSEVAFGDQVGCAGTAENAAAAPADLTGSAFWLLARIQRDGSVAASAMPGLHRTAHGPTRATGVLAAATLLLGSRPPDGRKAVQ